MELGVRVGISFWHSTPVCISHPKPPRCHRGAWEWSQQTLGWWSFGGFGVLGVLGSFCPGARHWEALTAPYSNENGFAWMSSPGILTCWDGVLIQKCCSGSLVAQRSWSLNAAVNIVNAPNPGLFQPNSCCVRVDRGWRGIFVWFFSSCWGLAAHPLSDSQLLQSALK